MATKGTASAGVLVSPNQNKNSQEILRQIHEFLKGASYRSKVSSHEQTRCALYLLQTLPAARHAVLEYLCTVFDDAVGAHIHSMEMGKSDMGIGDFEDVIDDIHTVLLKFVHDNPHAWAPIISAWSVELLGAVSSKYADRHSVPHASSLNELLQLWMTCSPTKILIGVVSECFASMVGDTPDICVDALLEASVKHSPHFDWVVAHIGSCFPKTIINRVLMCGLKDFHAHGNSAAEGGSVSGGEQVPKLGSVVGILGHLAGQHTGDIRVELLDLFQASLTEGAVPMLQCVPTFLLHLASMSPTLQRAVTTDIIAALTPRVLNQIGDRLAQQVGDCETLLNLAVHLVAKNEDSTLRMLHFLLDVASPHVKDEDAMETEEVVDPAVQNMMALIISKLLLDLQRVAHSKVNDGSVKVPFLQSFVPNCSGLCEEFAKSQGNRLQWVTKLLSCVGVYGGEGLAASILADIIMLSPDLTHLKMFHVILDEAQVKYPTIMGSTVVRVIGALEGQKGKATCDMPQAVRNLRQIVDMDKSSKDTPRACLQPQLQCHLVAICSILGKSDYSAAHSLIQLLTAAGLPPTLPADTATHVTHSATAACFTAIHSPEVNNKLETCGLCGRYLQSVCAHSPAAQKMVVRRLLEAALSPEHAILFGVTPPNSAAANSKLFLSKGQLMDTLVAEGTRLGVLYGGVIGQGLKPPPRPNPVPMDQQLYNKRLFLDILWQCSCPRPSTVASGESDDTRASPSSQGGSSSRSSSPIQTGTMSAAMARFLGLLVVELAAPDVMYNGIGWPEEEFNKVTVERDLIVKKTFENNPILWDVLEMLTEGTGSLCLCSTLLRSLAAALMAHWDGCRHETTTTCPWHLTASCRIISLMRKGQLLPAPLSSTHEIFHLLRPHEVHLVLLTIWRYMKENPPDLSGSPRLGCDPKYMDVIRHIFQGNINKLGHLYSRFFA